MAGGDTMARNTLGLGFAVCRGLNLCRFLVRRLPNKRLGTDGDGYVTGAVTKGGSEAFNERDLSPSRQIYEFRRSGGMMLSNSNGTAAGVAESSNAALPRGSCGIGMLPCMCVGTYGFS